MASKHDISLPEIKKTLEEFLEEFNQYASDVEYERGAQVLYHDRSSLQRKAPLVTRLIVTILGDATIQKGVDILRRSDALTNALMGGANEDPVIFPDWAAIVTSLLNQALGAIEAGLWPPKGPQPVLAIRDTVLMNRCSDLLRAPGNFDRVIREATIILEDRLRNRISHDRLTALIPDSAKQGGENLVNTLLLPGAPILSISTDPRERAAFQRIMLAVFAYLRNPFHHHIDDTTEWSWSWSIVGFIDHLLHELETCEETK